MKPLRNKIIIWLIATCLGVGIAIVTITLADRRIVATTASVQNLLTQAVASDSAIRSLIEAQRQAGTLEADLTTLHAAFIQNDNPLPYLTDLEALAAGTNVAVNFNIDQPSKDTLSNGAKIVPTTVTIVGSWNNTVAFINAMMQHAIYFSTTNIEIDGTQSTTAETLTTTLIGNTYWQ